MKSISLTTIILISCLAATLYAQECDNLLLDFFRFQPLPSPQLGANLPHCNHLKDVGTCCSVATVSTFQIRADGISDRINNYNAARDLFLAQLRSRYLDKFDDLLSNINDEHRDDLEEIRRNDPALADQLDADIASFNQARDESRDIQDHFLRTLREYQAARTTCLTTALNARSSAWCLACNPNYANEGLNEDGTVAYSEDLCETITNDCWSYFELGARFNSLIRIRQLFWRLLKVSEFLNNYPNGNVTNLNAEDPYKPLSSQLPVAVPERWNRGDGDCWDFWAGDKQLVKILALGSNAALLGAQGGTIAEEEGTFIDNTEALGDGIDFDGRMLYGLFHLIEDLTEPDVYWGIYPDPGYYYSITDTSDLTDLVNNDFTDFFL